MAIQITTRRMLNDTLDTSTNATLFRDRYADGAVNRVIPKKSADDSYHKHKRGPKTQFLSDYPVLGAKESPFYSVTRVDNLIRDNQGLKDMLQRTLDEAQNTYGPNLNGHYMRTGTQQQNVGTANTLARNLVGNIDNARATGAGYICRLPFPELNQHFKPNFQVEMAAKPGYMKTDSVMCNVLPYDTLTPLEHNDETETYCTVLKGKMVWMIWPSTAHNVQVLRRSYENRSTAQAVVADLEHGIIFGQNSGEGLHIWPFSIVIGLAAESAVFATCSVLYLDALFDSLRPDRAGLTNAFLQVQAYAEEQRSGYSKGLVKVVQQILEGEFDDFDRLAFNQRLQSRNPGLMHRLVNSWTQVHNDFLNLMYDEQDVADMGKVWSLFINMTLLSAGSQNRCPICQQYVDALVPGVNHEFAPGIHFANTHWRQPRRQAAVTATQAPMLSGSAIIPAARGTDQIANDNMRAQVEGSDGVEEVHHDILDQAIYIPVGNLQAAEHLSGSSTDVAMADFGLDPRTREQDPSTSNVFMRPSVPRDHYSPDFGDGDDDMDLY